MALSMIFAFYGIFALFWITTTPFIDLRNPDVLLAAEQGDALQQVASLAVFGLALTVLWRRRGAALVGMSSAFLAVLAWQAVTVVLSNHPDLSIRRFISSVMMLVAALAWPLAPRDAVQFSRLLAGALIAVLAISYAGIVFLPALSIHNLDEVLELSNAGAWRGHFDHKNIAGSAMVFTIFFALYVRHRQGWLVAGPIIAAATVFLVNSNNKTSIGLIALVLVLSEAIRRARTLPARAALAFVPLAVMATLTIGSVIFAPVHDLLTAVSSDPTYTNRTDVWRFGLDRLAEHPWFGFGYDAFWATSELVDGGYSIESWAAKAGHAHNGALNVALGTGIPGMLLVLYWVLWEPLRDYHRSCAGDNDSDLGLMYLRIWIFANFLSCLESDYFVVRGPVWFTIAAAIFGLRFHARAMQAARAGRAASPTWAAAAPGVQPW